MALAETESKGECSDPFTETVRRIFMRYKTLHEIAVAPAAPILLTSVLLLALAGCAQPAHNDTQVKHYELRGKVVSVDISQKSVSVDMQTIPGYMRAMEMTYPVHDPKALASLQPGDEISSDLVVASDGAYLQKIVLTGKGHGEKNAPPNH
jgi:Cu/Ag efflux protein CusF